MTCEHCGAPLHPDPDRGLLICDYCGSEAVPPESDDGVLVLEPSKYDCPLCRAKLQNASLEQIPLLYCEPCRGMLAAMDDMDALVSSMRSHHLATYVSPHNSSDGQRTVHCPRCGSAMDNHPYLGGGNVNVDSCESCASLWLDHGKLRKIAAAPDFQPLYLKYEQPRDDQ